MVFQAERAFGIQMQQYRSSDGHTFVANTSSPRLPLALHTLIQYVGGLNEGLQRHIHVAMLIISCLLLLRRQHREWRQGIHAGISLRGTSGDTGKLGAAKENLLLANPDMNGTRVAATVSILYAWGNSTTKTVNVTVAAKNQVIESVNADVGAGQIVAMKVSSTNGVPIVAERQQFFSYPSLVPTPSGVEVLGTTDGGHSLSSVYSFAEGHLGSSFSEYVTLFNPNSMRVRVSVTYFITNGARQTLSQQQVSLSPMGVMQIPVNTFLNVPSSATTASGVATDVSLVVQSMTSSNGTLLPIVAERSLYFNFVGTTLGATSVVGYGGN